MATTLTVYQDKQWISDFIKWEQDQRISRQVVTVGVSQTLLKGQIVANSGAGINDVQVFTLTCTDNTDAGSVKFQYGESWDKRSAAVAFGASLSAANVQAALRALGVIVGDVALAACTVGLSVAGAGANGAVYTVTCTTQYVPPLQVVENTLMDGTVAATLGSGDPVVNVGVHTIGAAPNNIVLLPAATSAVNEVVTISCTTSPNAGAFMIQVGNVACAQAAFNADAAAINALLDTAFGTGAIVATGDGLAGTSKSIILTFSGTGFAGRPITEGVSIIPVVSLGNTAALKVVRTTPGVAAVGAGLTGLYGIMLQDVTTSSSVPKQALAVTRHAVVDADSVTYGANVTTAAAKAAVLAALEANKMLVVRRQPGTSTTQAV